MIALTAGRCKRAFANTPAGATDCPASGDLETSGHGIVSGIILLPHFRPSTAPLPCEERILRWPGPFGSGFLSPQPPGAVGIGPVRRGVNPQTLGQRELVLFLF